MLKYLIPPVMAVACLASVNAYAVGPGYLGDMTNKTVNIGNTFTVPGAFEDVYIFDTVASEVAVGAAITIDLDLAFLPGPEFQLSNMRVEFFDPSNASIAFDTLTGPTDTLVVQTTIPAALGYKFIVSGDVTGSFGGSYGGLLQMVMPVPEAETWALLLAGLGILASTRLGRLLPRSSRTTPAALA